MKWFPKYDVRVLSIVVSFCILLGSIPLSSGVVIASHAKQPTVTLNVCERLQAALSVLGIPIARPATSSPHLILLEHGKVPPSLPKPLIDLSIAPESPPPKAPV